MAGSDAVVIRANWETYSYSSPDGPVFVSFYAGAGEIARDEFPFCARVILPIQRPNANGGPTGDEAETLWRLEDELTARLARHGAKCLLVARLTQCGRRELVFQVADWDAFRPPVGLWMQQVPEYEIDVSEHDGWDFFDSCVWPSDDDWMLISDRRVVDRLVEAGSNPTKEHCLDFMFRGDRLRLRTLREDLVRRGYVEIERQAAPDQLLMVKRLPLDLARINSESLENRRRCEELGIEFDGWGAAVVK